MTLKPGTEAPKFELEAIHRDNRKVSSWFNLENQLRKGPVFAIFAKRSCPTCHWCLPLFDRLHRTYHQTGASVVLVLQDSRPEAEEFAVENGLAMPITIDPAPHAVSEAYGIVYVPTSFWIGPDGRIERVIEAFERESLNQVNIRLAKAAGSIPRPLFAPDEHIPAFRPG